MTSLKKTPQADRNYIAQSFKELLDFTQRQIRILFEWMVQNPEKVALIIVAIGKAYAGDFSDVIDVSYQLIAI